MKKKIICKAFRKSQALLLSALVFLSALSGATLAKYAGTFATNGFKIAITATTGTGSNPGYNGTETPPVNNPGGFTGGVTGSFQTFTATASGYYKLEVWGAQGGNCTTEVDSVGQMTRYGGLGGYAAGYVWLDKDEMLYITVGGKGQGSTNEGINLAGGYNGGGSCYISGTVNHVYGSGGGATHIAKSLKGDGQLKNYVNNKNDVLIVAGGGGGARLQRNANYDDRARWGNGGDGGGETGGVGKYKDGTTLSYVEGNVIDGPETFYESFDVFNELAATATHGYAFGQGESEYGNGGGGGGWYGGHGGTPDGHTDRYMGFGLGGSGHLDSSLIKTQTGMGINAGNGKAAITYAGKDVNALTEIAKPTADTIDRSGYVQDLDGGSTRVNASETRKASVISLFGENGAIDGATK